MNFLRKVLLEVVNLTCNNSVAFRIFRRIGLFQAVFVMYPADSDYADYFTFRARQWFITWKPFITGVIKHPSGERSLKFAISAHVDGKDSHVDSTTMHTFHSGVEKIAKQLGASTIHFAGTLPGRLTAFRVRRGDNQRNERQATEENVIKAVTMLRATLSHGNENFVVVLGSKGYVGKGVVSGLEQLGIRVLSVDKDGVFASGRYLGDRYIQPRLPHIMLNITRPEAINAYIDPATMSNCTTVLNEVYPAPHPDVVSQMKDLGARVFHIGGVVASVAPLPFPSAYCGAVPCCAALPGTDYQVKVIEM